MPFEVPLKTQENVHLTEKRIILNLQRSSARDENDHRPQALEMKCQSHLRSATLPEQQKIRNGTSKTEDVKP